MALVGHISLFQLWSQHNLEFCRSGLLWVLQVRSFRTDWSVDGASTAAIAEAREAVEGCVPRGQLAPVFTREFDLE